MTRTRFLNIEDSLEIGKLRLFAGEYSKGNGMTSNAYHFVDVDDARVLLSDLSWNKAVNVTDYKGTNNGQVISRVLSVKSKDDKVWFELKNGPGKATETGAITPAGEPTASVSIALTIPEARHLAHATLAYIHAYDVAQMLR